MHVTCIIKKFADCLKFLKFEDVCNVAKLCVVSLLYDFNVLFPAGEGEPPVL